MTFKGPTEKAGFNGGHRITWVQKKQQKLSFCWSRRKTSCNGTFCVMEGRINEVRMREAPLYLKAVKNSKVHLEEMAYIDLLFPPC